MLIDTHTHYFKKNFDGDRKKILEELKEQDIKVIETAIGYESNENVLRLCESYPDLMRVTLGCHPNCVKEMTEERWRELVNRICDNRYVVAIGETGLDYTRALKPEEQALQRFWTGRFVELSKGIKKPLVIHCRGEKAYDDLHELLLEHDICGQVEHPGVIHCFSGGEEDIKRFGALGFYFGIGGLFLKDEKVKQSIYKMPLERVLLETDSPYLLPAGLTGKRNTSLNLHYVTDKLSEIWGTNTQYIIEQANKNAAAVFGEW